MKSTTTSKIVATVAGILVLGITVYVVSKAWKKGQAA
jgi:hypothetical protein